MTTLIGQTLTGIVDFPINMRGLRNFLEGKLPQTQDLYQFGQRIPQGPNMASVVIKPDATSFMAIRTWLDRRGLINTKRYQMFGRIGWTTHAVRVDKTYYGMRFTFEDELDAVMFRMTWDLMD